MAETITRQLREPFVESAGLGITDRGLQLLKDPIPTATYTGRQCVQGQSALEQQAAAAAAGLDSLVGPQAYKDFMSPYQQEVIDTSLAAMDREQQKGIGALRQRAAQSGAFGGGREAAALGEYQATADIARAGMADGGITFKESAKDIGCSPCSSISKTYCSYISSISVLYPDAICIIPSPSAWLFDPIKSISVSCSPSVN